MGKSETHVEKRDKFMRLKINNKQTKVARNFGLRKVRTKNVTVTYARALSRRLIKQLLSRMFIQQSHRTDPQTFITPEILLIAFAALIDAFFSFSLLLHISRRVKSSEFNFSSLLGRRYLIKTQSNKLTTNTICRAVLSR